jgi:hypothetical protein
VSYRFGEQEIRLHEVEVELKPGGTRAMIEELVKSLRKTFGPVLRPWSPSKLATGLALEALACKAALAGLLDADNNLRPQGYDVLNKLLTGSHGPAQPQAGKND